MSSFFRYFQNVEFLKEGHCLNIIGDLKLFKVNFCSFFSMASFGEGAFRLSLRKNIPLILAG